MTREGIGAESFVVGHDWALDLLKHSLTEDRLSHAYLFLGPGHVGKTALALYLAQQLNCLEGDGRPCGTCSACRRIGRGTHPDVRVIDGESGRIKIDQIRELQRESSLSPFEGRWRVYIVRQFERATVEAANCLLKTLEEPPPRVVLLLTADMAECLLPTIVSRCQVFHLRPLPLSQVEQALQVRWGLEPQKAGQLARLSQGRIGWAVRAAQDESVLRNREKQLLALEQALKLGVTQRFGLAQQLCQNAERLPELLDSWEGWWRDVLLASSGCEDLLTNVDRVQTLKAEARQLGSAEALAALHAVQRCGQQVEENVNACLALEVLLLALPRRHSVER